VCALVSSRMRTLQDVLRFWVAIVFLAAALCGFADGTRGRIRAAAPQDWEAMAIYFPADQQRKIVPNNYVPIELAKLQEKLAAEGERRKSALLNAPELAEAVYIVQLDKDQLVSDCSLWRFVGMPSKTPFALGQVSFALRDARGMPAGYEQLSKDLRFESGGGLEVVYPSNAAERWFGFVNIAQPESEGRSFDIRVPAATLARMLVAAPRQYELSSADVAIEAIANPADYFPTQWPMEQGRLLDAADRWWLINLSGKSRMGLTVTPVVADDSMWHKHTLRSADTEYTIGDETIALSATFDFAASSNGSPVRLRFSDGLRVKDVLVDGAPARWKSAASLAGDSNLIELSQPSPSSGSVVNITASGRFEKGQDVLLPEVAIAESYAIAGTARVLIAEDMRTMRLEAEGTPLEGEGTPLSSKLRKNQGEEGARSVRFSGGIDWVGVQPRITGRFSSQMIPWQANGLTRFTIQNASISASTQIRLSSQRIDSNEVRLAVGKEWFVDDVKLVNDSGGDLRAQFLEVGTERKRRTEVVISWERERSTVDFELIVNAHIPRVPDLNKVELQLSQLLSLDGAVQQETFVVESGRYRLQLNQGLLRYQKQAGELLDWQRALLPQLTDIWILQSVNNSIPPLTFLASTGTFSSKTNTLVQINDEQVLMDYRIRCEPISGTLDRVKILLPNSIDATQLAFSLLLSSDGKLIPLNPSDILVHNDSGVSTATEQEVDILLPTPIQSACEIRTSLSARRETVSAPIDILIPGVPRATSAESIVILPKALAQFREKAAIELLPVQACCTSDEILSLSELGPASTLVAARIDASESSVLRVFPSSSDESSGWAWEQLLDKRLLDDGSRKYRVEWDIEVGNRAEIQVVLPDAWILNHAFVDGVLTKVRGTNAAMTLEVPPNQRSKLVMECTRLPPRGSWLSRFATQLDSDRPEINLPVLVAKQRVLIPPSKIAVDSLGTMPQASRLVDRLLPLTWWHWFAPHAFALAKSGTEEAGWSGFETAFAAQDERRWVVERSAIAAFLLSGLLVLSTTFWLILGRVTRRWWVLISALAVLVVLVPVSWLAMAQLLLLSASLAAFARMVQVILQSKSVSRNISVSRSGRGMRELRVPLLLIATTGWAVAYPASSLAQDTNRSPSTTESVASDADARTGVFGILLPLDEAGNLSGNYAHIPSDLDKLLSPASDSLIVAGPPKIVSAEYVLNTRASTTNQQEMVQSFSATLHIEVTRLETPLRLPFDAKQIELVNGEVKGREVLVGLSTLKQEAEAVVFKPTELGVQTIKLGFIRNPDSNESTASHFSTSIPRIASATLKINSGGNTKFEVNAVGGTERISTSEFLSYLGPIGLLDVTWNDSAPLRGLPTPIDVTSETWVHASHGQLMAACQLRSVNPERPLPQVLQVNVDANWEPVGTDWGDAKLTMVETPAFVNRRVYTTQFATPATKESPQILRVLLVPKNTEKLSLPFLTMQGVAAPQRVLAFSSSEADSWKPDGIETWLELFRDLPNWGPLELVKNEKAELAQPKRVFRVPSTYSQLLLRRQPNRPVPIVNELTDVYLRSEHVGVDFYATWESQSIQESILSLRIPLHAEVTETLINGRATSYRISERADYAQLFVATPERSEPLADIRVKLKLPQQYDIELPLPRVVMERVSPRRSQYRLFRAENIDCDKRSNDANLQWSSFEVNDATQLDTFEIPIGELELGAGYRELAALPLSTRCRKAKPAACRVAIQQLVRGADGWTVKVSAEWDADAKLDFVYFDLPIGIRDTISSSFARKFLPSADASRTILSLVPAISSSSKYVDFTFPLTGVSTQSLSIPQVRLLAERVVVPVVALPTAIDGQDVVWKKVGRRLGQVWHEQTKIAQSTEFNYFAHDERQMQINWVPVGKDKVQVRLEHTFVAITNISETEVSGVVSYWITPRGQLSLDINVPENCELLGVEMGNEVAIWRLESNRRVSVTLQPNYLPVHLQCPLRWKRNEGSDVLRIAFPEIVGEKANHEMLVSCGGWERTGQVAWAPQAKETLEPFESLLLDRWGSLVASTLQAQKGLLPSETEAWLSTWEPTSIGIGPQTTISPALEALLDRGYIKEDESRLSVTDFWELIAQQYNLQTRPEMRDANRGEGEVTSPFRSCYLSTNQTDLTFLPIVESVSSGTRWLAAGLLSMAAILAMALAYRLRTGYLALLSRQPWLYWLQLAAIAWLLLPVLWPSCLLAVTALFMLVSQLLDSGQRNRTFRRT
jgi:hypothetical protein